MVFKQTLIPRNDIGRIICICTRNIVFDIDILTRLTLSEVSYNSIGKEYGICSVNWKTGYVTTLNNDCRLKVAKLNLWKRRGNEGCARKSSKVLPGAWTTIKSFPAKIKFRKVSYILPKCQKHLRCRSNTFYWKVFPTNGRSKMRHFRNSPREWTFLKYF